MLLPAAGPSIIRRAHGHVGPTGDRHAPAIARRGFGETQAKRILTSSRAGISFSGAMRTLPDNSRRLQNTMRTGLHFSKTAAVLSILAMHATPAGADTAPVPTGVERVCELIGNKLTSVSVEECLLLGLTETGARTTLGHPILRKEYPPLGTRKPNARVLLIGGTHGDEYAAFSVPIKWMKILNVHHSGLFHWHIAPALNLDGLLESPAVRVNHNAVDLNRNMKTAGDWEKAALLHWEKETGANPRRYPGRYPLSERETRWLSNEIDTFKPDVIVSVHTPYNIIDYDGPQNITPPARLGSIELGDLGSFPGSLGRYAGEELGIPVVTIELASSRYMPPDAELRRIWVDLVRWLRLNIRSRPEPSG